MILRQYRFLFGLLIWATGIQSVQAFDTAQSNPFTTSEWITYMAMTAAALSVLIKGTYEKHYHTPKQDTYPAPSQVQVADAHNVVETGYACPAKPYFNLPYLGSGRIINKKPLTLAQKQQLLITNRTEPTDIPATVASGLTSLPTKPINLPDYKPFAQLEEKTKTAKKPTSAPRVKQQPLLITYVPHKEETPVQPNLMGAVQENEIATPTPLQDIAVEYHQAVATVQKLLQAGADPHIRNERGQQAKDFTRDENVLRMLNEV